jgi:hypothetical protein
MHSSRIKKAKYDKNVNSFVKILEKKDKRIAKMTKTAQPPVKRGRPAKKQQPAPQPVQPAPISE